MLADITFAMISWKGIKFTGRSEQAGTTEEKGGTLEEGSDLRPWKTLSKETVLDMGKFLTVENHTVEWPDGRVITDWAWLIAPDAAIILAVTPDQKFLCFRQTKYAIEGSSLAPPGGMVDDGEDPLEAAKRELLEETGFASSDWSSLGSYKADPNRGIGTRHFYLIRDAHRVADPDSDDVEDQHLLFPFMR